MASIDSLLDRIDAQFSSSQEKLKSFRAEQTQQHIERGERLEKLGAVLEELSSVWRPRLEALLKKFGDRAKVTPTITPSRRSAQFKIDNDLARIDLRFTSFADQDVRNVVFTYDLEISPILMKFDSHAEISFPTDKIDRESLAQWIDDRIVSFVQIYLSIYENQYYLKGHLVEDPIAKIQFPKFAAGATLEQNGKTLYFIDERTRDEYKHRAIG
jgi:hypothetical protein